MMPSTVVISCDHRGHLTKDKGDKHITVEQNDGKMFVLDAAVEPVR